MRLYLITLVLGCLSACTLDNPSKHVIILGHAGAGVDLVNASYKPNTEKAIRAAVEVYQLDGVEVDVQFCSDGVGVLFHDPFVENAVGELKGRVHEQKSDDLIGKNFRGHPKNNQEEVLSLAWLLGYAQQVEEKIIINLDLKVYDPNFNKVEKSRYLDSLITAYGIKEQVIIESKSKSLLLEIERLDSTYVCLLHTEFEESMIKQLHEDKLDGAVMRFNQVNQDIIHTIEQFGLTLSTYGQVIQADFNHIGSINADMVQVDNPVLALSWRD